MRNMIEFNSSLLIPIFIIMATGFVILTLPMGVLFTQMSRRLAVPSMSGAPSVLFDAPGPKARLRHRILTVVAGVILLGRSC